MKKNLLLTMMAGAMFASCSDDVTNSENFILGDNDPVEVKFSGANIEASVDRTRALMEGWENAGPLTLMGLAKESDADWTKPESVLFKDDVNGCVDATVSNKGAITKLGNGGPYYYPFDSKRNFSFYACYPKGTVMKTKDKVTVNYADVTGDKDILAGSAVSKYEDGFNAKYYRQHLKEPNVSITNLHPSLNLEHMLTRLDFFVVKGDNDTEVMKVKSILIKEVPTNLVLTLANKNNPSPTLELASNPLAKDITVYDGNPNMPSGAIGSVAVYPSSLYKIAMVLVGPNEVLYSGDIIPLYTKDKTPFKPGTRYQVTLKIYGMRKVEVLNVDVKNWEPGDNIEEEVN